MLKSGSGMDVISNKRNLRNLSYLPSWFQRHLNSKILERDVQLPTIIGL